MSSLIWEIIGPLFRSIISSSEIWLVLHAFVSGMKVILPSADFVPSGLAARWADLECLDDLLFGYWIVLEYSPLKENPAG